MSKELNKLLNDAENEKIRLADSTERKKQQFINELKTGLGTELKQNPGKVKIIKTTISQRIKNWLKSIFTKF